MDINSVIQQLDLLKAKYRERSVSLLVGAGFSKNACESFPSWTELLYDMADELYSTTIARDYDLFRQSHPTYRGSLNTYKKKVIPALIARVGYLSMVSEYVKRKGFREAIEYYIEERIPYIDENANAFRFTGKNAGVSYPIKLAHFAAHSRLLDGQWEQIYTTNYDRLLEYAYKIAGKEDFDSLVIKDAPQLTIGRGQRTIIKLHGNLQHPDEERVFSFDGNPHQQYIISGEDYLEYPKQHEAFTQLMRISLLQGVFCLVGFSGDDPNFQAWLSWVRDILSRGVGKKKEYKIFLVDKTDQLASQDKEIFYENHNICYIPLEHPDIKRHIASTSPVFRQVLVDFFNFLYKDMGDGASNGTGPELGQTPSYTNLWSRLDSDLSGEPNEVQEKHEKTASIIIKEKPFNRLVHPSYYHEEFLSKADANKSLSATDAVLSLIALKDTGLLLSCFKRLTASINKSIPERYRADYISCIERDALLTSASINSLTGLTNSSERVLQALFALDFKTVHSIIDAWEPEGADILKKAYYLAFFDTDLAKKLLSSFIDSSLDAKERFYATRLLNVLENSFTPIHPVSYFTSTGVVDYWKIGDKLFHNVVTKKEEIRPHGVGKSKVIYLDGGPKDVDYPKAMAVLNFLMDAPFAISYRNFVTLRNSVDWYKVHIEIFERHPFASLYYSLQCTDKKILTRIGQDYAYSDTLASTCLPEILKNLLTSYLAEETPVFLKSAILRIAREILIAVNPGVWEALFMRIWHEKAIANILGMNDPRFPELERFVFQGLDSIQSALYRASIITDILEHSNEDGTFAINALYYLDKQGLSRDDAMGKSIDSFIAAITKPWQIVVAGNLYGFLTKENIVQVKNKLSSLLGIETLEDVEYSSASHFIFPEDNELQRKFIQSICSSPLLWQTGVHSNGHYKSGDSAFLKISSYRAFPCTEEDLKSLYGKLKDSLSVVTSSHVFESPFFHLMSLEDVMLEMHTFLTKNKNILQKQPDYSDVLKKVTAVYGQTVDNHSVEDGLLSVYSEELSASLEFIYNNRSEIERTRFLSLLNIVLTRLLLMNSDGLDECLRYVRYFVTDGTITEQDESVLESIIMMLDKTTLSRLNDCDLNLAHATNNLTEIAKKLAKWRFDSEGVRFWIDFAKRHRFYTNFI